MANHQITISNSFNVFGVGATTKWNEFNWGEANWGEGTIPVETQVNRIIDNTLVLSSTIIKTIRKPINNTLSLVAGPEEQFLRTGNGYYYEFTRPTLNNNEKVVTDWSET